MNRYLFIAMLFMVGCSDTPANAQIENTPITGQHFQGKVTVEASKEKAWNVIADANQLFGLLNYKYLSGTQKFSKAGDVSRLEDWGDEGTFVLTKAMTNSELRFGFEPDNGSYFCAQKWMISQNGDQTTINFELNYTESGPQTKESIINQANFYKDMLIKLKAVIEGS